MMNPVVGSPWVELHAAAHLGAIRALAAGVGRGLRLGPGLAGALIDGAAGSTPGPSAAPPGA